METIIIKSIITAALISMAMYLFVGINKKDKVAILLLILTAMATSAITTILFTFKN